MLLDLSGMLIGDPQIYLRQRQPFFGCSRLRIEKMCQRESGTEAGPVAAVKVRQTLCLSISEVAAYQSLYPSADPACAQPLALNLQIGKLVKGV